MCFSLTNIVGSACSHIFSNIISNFCDKCSLSGSLIRCCRGPIFCCSYVSIDSKHSDEENYPLLEITRQVNTQANKIYSNQRGNNRMKVLKGKKLSQESSISEIEEFKDLGAALWEDLCANRFNWILLSQSERYPEHQLTFLKENLQFHNFDKLQEKKFLELEPRTQRLVIEAGYYSSPQFISACRIQSFLKIPVLTPCPGIMSAQIPPHVIEEGQVSFSLEEGS